MLREGVDVVVALRIVCKVSRSLISLSIHWSERVFASSGNQPRLSDVVDRLHRWSDMGIFLTQCPHCDENPQDIFCCHAVSELLLRVRGSTMIATQPARLVSRHWSLRRHTTLPCPGPNAGRIPSLTRLYSLQNPLSCRRDIRPSRNTRLFTTKYSQRAEGRPQEDAPLDFRDQERASDDVDVCIVGGGTGPQSFTTGVTADGALQVPPG